MNGAADQFLSFALVERRRHRQRLYVASVVAVLIVGLLYQTQWVNLRAGLLVLLAGQAGDVLALFLRNAQISRDVERNNAGLLNDAAFSAWFEREEFFIKHLAFFDTACQTIGFLALGYALWISTRSVTIALAIGLLYPITIYFAMTRKKTLAGIRRLRAKKQELVMAS
jgi:hypothetical protein